MNPLQCITVQYMPWHRLAQSRAIASRDTPLESSILLETRRNGGQPKELSHGYSIYDHWIVNTTRRRRWVIAESGLGREGTVKSSGTSARERRLEKYREEKRRREHQNKNVYPEWAKVLEEACKDDKELREIIGDSIGNAEMMRKRVEERVRMKGRDIIQSKSGSVLPVKVSFRNFNPTDSYVWIELDDSPSDKDVDFIGKAIRSWYVLGRLGGFNASNLQLTQLTINEKMRYDSDQAMNALSSVFHDISNLEFQDNWARFWVDMGTSDTLALDVLINALICLSSSYNRCFTIASSRFTAAIKSFMQRCYVGIKQLVFGGKSLGDWEEGMTSVEDGYRVYQI